MAGTEELSRWIFDNIQRLFFPEEWIALDQRISKTELLALFFVERQTDATMSRLADFLSVPLSTATGIVDRLVKNGYLLRERPEADRRVVVLRVAEGGAATLSRLKDTISGYIDRIQEVLSPEEQSAALKLVMKILDALKRERGLEGPAEGSPRLQRISIE